MKRLLPFLVACAWLLAACNFSLAGDVVPPEGALISGETAAEPITAPERAADLGSGEALFAQYCVACHGETGLGDGEQSGQLPFAPPALADPDVARAASPEDWFRMVTQGRITRYMPPFEQALSAQERWNVVAYALSLSTTAEELAQGAALYAEQQEQVDALVKDDLLAINQESIAPLRLSSNDSHALTAYLQALALGMDQVSDTVEPIASEPATDAEPPATGEPGTISGQVTYGSQGDFPIGLTITLAAFDHTEQVLEQTADIAEDGSYEFKNIPIAEDRIFFVEVEYGGLRYFSEFVSAETDQDSLTLPVTIFDTTQDTDSLAIDSHQFVFDFSSAGNVRVVERVAITNLGDKTVAPGEAGEALLHYQLPPAASNLTFQDGALGERYLPEENGFGDLRGVLPGQNSYQLLFSYTLPYSSYLNYQISIDLPTRTLVALLPDGQLQMLSDDFQLVGSQQLENTNFQVYSADAGYQAGDVLDLEISGKHPLGGGGLGSLGDDDGLLVGLGALTLAVGVAWLWARRAKTETRESIMDEILLLEERYEAGEVSEKVYLSRRAALKGRLGASLQKGPQP